MAKVKFSPNFGKLTIARAKRLARVAITDSKLANRIKNKLILPIKKERKLPSGKKVPSNSKEWILHRRKLGMKNKTSKFFKNFVSNMTFTGRFLNSFKAKVSKKRLVTYEIGPEGSHRGYTGVKGGKGKTVDNAKIGQGFIDRGVDYTVISERNKKEIAKSVKARIIKEFKLNL